MTSTRDDPAARPAASRAATRPARLPVTAEGLSSASFEPLDWGLLALASIVWGSSFLLIAEALETMEPGVVAWLRILFGITAVAAIPASRRRAIDRSDLPRVALLGAVWLAIPMTMFPVAEQWVSSSVAGMLNGAVPLFSALVAAMFLRRAPGRNQVIGLLIGFVGVVAISLPSLQGGSRTAVGVSLVLVALISYGFAGNIIVPLQHRYGAMPVILRAQAFGLLFTTPYALIGAGDSSLGWKSLGAVVLLGAFGTGVAFAAAGTLMGRVGATRGSVIGYLIPVVALLLGVLLRNEDVEAIAIAGLGIVLAGAWVVSRAGR